MGSNLHESLVDTNSQHSTDSSKSTINVQDLTGDEI
jgi:hypothetical protein